MREVPVLSHLSPVSLGRFQVDCVLNNTSVSEG